MATSIVDVKPKAYEAGPNPILKLLEDNQAKSAEENARQQRRVATQGLINSFGNVAKSMFANYGASQGAPISKVQTTSDADNARLDKLKSEKISMDQKYNSDAMQIMLEDYRRAENKQQWLEQRGMQQADIKAAKEEQYEYNRQLAKDAAEYRRQDKADTITQTNEYKREQSERDIQSKKDAAEQRHKDEMDLARLRGGVSMTNAQVAADAKGVATEGKDIIWQLESSDGKVHKVTKANLLGYKRQLEQIASKIKENTIAGKYTEDAEGKKTYKDPGIQKLYDQFGYMNEVDRLTGKPVSYDPTNQADVENAVGKLLGMEVDQYEQKLSSEGEKQSTNMMKTMQGGKTTMVPPPVNLNAAAPKARDFSQMTMDQARKMADSGEVAAMSVLDYKAFTKAMNKLLK